MNTTVVDGLSEEFLGFLRRAREKCYLNDRFKDRYQVKPKRKDSTEYRFVDGDWVYVDCYSGSMQSWGQETVWYKGKIYWTMLYGGNVFTENFPEGVDEKDYKEKILRHLKKALLANSELKLFWPRGTATKRHGGLMYKCEWDGDVSKFNGYEEIIEETSPDGKVVFHHDFMGGFYK